MSGKQICTSYSLLVKMMHVICELQVKAIDVQQLCMCPYCNSKAFTVNEHPLFQALADEHFLVLH